MKSVIFTFVSAAAMFALGSAAPAAEAVDAPVATLVEGVSLETLELAGQNSTVTKRGNGSFQAFDGSKCDGNRGLQLGISNTISGCIGTQGRHSYAVLGCDAVVTLFELDGCRGRQSVMKVNPGCWNVHTGYNWASSTASCP